MSSYVAGPPATTDAVATWPLPRTCRICGCTDDDCTRCIERVGIACSWVVDDLCSACWRFPDATLIEAAAARKRHKGAVVS